jgi:maltose O-acetyltransferase
MTFHINPSDTGKNTDLSIAKSTKEHSKFVTVLHEEFSAVHPRYLVVQFFVSLLPHNSLNRLRTFLYRLCGLSIGKGTVILGKMTLTAQGPMTSRLTIGGNCRINTPLYLELNAPITIGQYVAIGHHVVFITTDHDISCSDNRSGAVTCQPITIEDGAWIGAGVKILPGVTIGKGSVVAAGSLVTQSVPANRLVGGVPARPVKTLES